METKQQPDSPHPPRRTLSGIIRASFRAKLFAVTAFGILILSLVFTILFLTGHQQAEKDKLTTEGQLLARLLAHNCRLGLFAGNRENLHEIAEGTMATPEVLSVTIFDRDGRSLVHLERPSLKVTNRRSEFSEQVLARQGNSTETELYFPSQQTGSTRTLIGKVRVVMDEEPVYRHLRELLLTAVLVATAFLLAGSAVIYLVIRGITRPLTHLADGVRSIEAGDKVVSIPVESEDEIGSLTASFNGMAAALRERQQERDEAERQILELNAHLEEKVRERTAQLEASNRELESFNYSAAHDLRSPIVRLNGLCLALEEDCGARLDDEMRDYFRRISAVGGQMERVITSMSSLFQVQRRAMSLRKFDLSTLVGAAVSARRETEPEREITLTVEPAVTVCGDMDLLWVAMENLVGNAWKFTSRAADARIEFGAELRGGETVCFIRDNGAGFDMAYSGKLFQPFQRLHGPDEFPGTGVGLAIVQRIIGRHGGRIWLESAPGSGTTCWFTLPPVTEFCPPR
ncbi:MAG: sensor histidine kinase [Desulfuromonadales bacterium]|nr:MAG: sensor histidine kinase [Desulfuromonadales bacterium]